MIPDPDDQVSDHLGPPAHLIDSLDFSVLAPTCAEFRRWSFLCGIAPLRLAVATGSPVNPVAIL
jgi:hypothetical protein